MDSNVKYVVSITKVVFDLLLLIFFGVRPIYSFLLGEVAQRGFYCNDESIRYPFVRSIPLKGPVVFAGETTFVALIILTTEIFLHYRNKFKVSISGFKLPMCIWNAYCAVTGFLFGAAITRFATLFYKNRTGALRPHFMDVCRPSIDCTDANNLNVFHTNFTCTNSEFSDSIHVMREIRQSFPCGQIATSMYCMLYFCIYLQFKMTWKGSKFFKHVIQFVAINLSLYIGIQNYVVYYHHPNDIVAGTVQGVVFAVVTAVCLGRFELNKGSVSEYEDILP